MKRKPILTGLVIVFIATVILILWCDRSVARASEGRLYSDVDSVRFNHVGLLLGTGKYLSNGQLNYYYKYRIDAALALMQSNKIRYVVVSGDNSRKDYNEPEMMRQDLMKAGIDSARIILDYAGFRTFDSIIRLREIFGQDSVTIISQPFHNQRAIYLASKEGIAAIGFNARDVQKQAGLKVQMREKLARVKVFLDYLFHVQPKFLGPKVVIPS
jgi:SanA protein